MTHERDGGALELLRRFVDRYESGDILLGDLMYEARAYLAQAEPQAALRARAERAEADAERYRWLRRFDRFAKVDAMLNTTTYNTLDAAVDSAMSAQGDA